MHAITIIHVCMHRSLEHNGTGGTFALLHNQTMRAYNCCSISKVACRNACNCGMKP